jgi:hypothetical protein
MSQMFSYDTRPVCAREGILERLRKNAMPGFAFSATIQEVNSVQIHVIKSFVMRKGSKPTIVSKVCHTL